MDLSFYGNKEHPEKDFLILHVREKWNVSRICVSTFTTVIKSLKISKFFTVSNVVSFVLKATVQECMH